MGTNKREEKRQIAAPKYSGVKWTQINADLALDFDYITEQLQVPVNNVRSTVMTLFLCGYL
jgi:hypothetical protein